MLEIYTLRSKDPRARIWYNYIFLSLFIYMYIFFLKCHFIRYFLFLGTSDTRVLSAIVRWYWSAQNWWPTQNRNRIFQKWCTAAKWPSKHHNISSGWTVTYRWVIELNSNGLSKIILTIIIYSYKIIEMTSRMVMQLNRSSRFVFVIN